MKLRRTEQTPRRPDAPKRRPRMPISPVIHGGHPHKGDRLIRLDSCIRWDIAGNRGALGTDQYGRLLYNGRPLATKKQQKGRPPRDE